MRNQPIDLGTMVIASSGTDSTAIEFKRKPVRGVAIYAPAALTGTVTLYVSADSASTYQKLQSAGSDITIGAGDCVVVDAVACDYMRVTSGSAEASARTFVVMAYEDVT
jgi:hypothetical protein